MAFNPKQFKVKKKREVDPNAPPRPNLLSQDKKLRETDLTIKELQSLVQRQGQEIKSLKTKYESMQSGMSQMIAYMRNLKGK